MIGSSMAPLAGLKVLDLSQIMAGPYCTMVLADLGRGSDQGREGGQGRRFARDGPLRQRRVGFLRAHQPQQEGHRHQPQGSRRAARSLYELARWADVVVENFRVGVTTSLGVDYETLSRINPRLVYCSISGFGQTGPYAHKGGFDLVAQGITGMMSMTGETGRPAAQGRHRDLRHRRRHHRRLRDPCRPHPPDEYRRGAAYRHLARGMRPAMVHLGGGRLFHRRHRAQGDRQPAPGVGSLPGVPDRQRLHRDRRRQPALLGTPVQRRARTGRNSSRIRASPPIPRACANVEELEALLEEEFAKADAATWIARCEQAGVPCGPINDFGQALAGSALHGSRHDRGGRPSGFSAG